MSKMYRALEKAQRERRATVKSIKTEKGPIVSKGSIKEKPADRSMYLSGPNALAAHDFPDINVQTDANRIGYQRRCRRGKIDGRE